MVSVMTISNTETEVLTYRGHSHIVVGEKRVPETFFQDRKGFWVYGGFLNRIAELAETTCAGAAFALDFNEITAKNGATDVQIETVLGGRNIFTETQVCAIIAEMISRQNGGREGVLLNNGYPNLFYTPSLVVDVRCVGSREWHVSSSERDDDEWDLGSRVFVPSD